MKILLFGHSYVRDLANFGQWDRQLDLRTGESIPVEFAFKSFPGKDYGYFLDNPSLVTQIRQDCPDVIVLILGGNSITASISDLQLKEQAATFYELLNEQLKGDCLKLAVQVEPRFMPTGNRFGVPDSEVFNRRRQTINNFVNRQLKRRGLVDRVITLGSVNYLNDPRYFRDGVHLRGIGLERYKDSVIAGVRYALEHKQ